MAFMGATDGVHFTITATDMASRTIRGVGRSLLWLGATARTADNRMHRFFWRGTDDVKMWARVIAVSLPMIPAALVATANAAGGLVSALTSLTPGVGAFAASIIGNFDKIKKSAAFGDLMDEWKEFLVDTRPVALEAAATAMGALEKLLPKLVPLANTFGQVFTDWMQRVSDSLDTKAFENFLEWARTIGAINFENVLNSFSNLAAGIGQLSMAMSSSGTGVTQWLENITEKFKNWTAALNKPGGMDRFYQFWRDNWPPLREMFKQFVLALSNIMTALQPLGPHMVAGLTAAFKAIAGADPAHIRAVAMALLAFRGVNLALAATSAAVSGLSGSLIGFKRASNGVNDAGRKTERGFMAASRGASLARLGIAGAVLAIIGASSSMIRENEKVSESWGRLKRNASNLAQQLKIALGPSMETILTKTFDALATGSAKAANALPKISSMAQITARLTAIAMEVMLRALGKMLGGFAGAAAKLAPFNPLMGRIATGMAGAAGKAIGLANSIARLRSKTITVRTNFVETRTYISRHVTADPVKGDSYGYAAGGRPPVGRASLVGERGPEMWVPDRPGTILPADVTARLLAANESDANKGTTGPTAQEMLDAYYAMLRELVEIRRYLDGLPRAMARHTRLAGAS